MSCENNVSRLIYFLTLQKSVPDNKSNIHKKNRAEAGKKKRERERQYRRKAVDNEPERKVLVTMFEAPSLNQT